MLKEARLPHVLDALDHECETRDHQRHEIPERASEIENTCSNMLITKKVKSDEGSACQRAEKDEGRLKYCELWPSAGLIHRHRNLLNLSDGNQHYRLMHHSNTAMALVNLCRACRNATLCAPSRTSSITSSPRTAGRSCMKIVSLSFEKRCMNSCVTE
jgi:hypothetical protein